MPVNDLKTEWCLLQNQYDSYEKYALLIKLAAVVIAAACLLVGVSSALICIIVLVLWGQDAIWKTFQSRIETRLLLVEESLCDDRDENAFQFNRQFYNSRPRGASLIKVYAHQAIRPTIAFPYVVLLPLLLVNVVFFAG